MVIYELNVLRIKFLFGLVLRVFIMKEFKLVENLNEVLFKWLMLIFVLKLLNLREIMLGILLIFNLDLFFFNG